MTSPSASPYEWRKSTFTDGVQCGQTRLNIDNEVEFRDDRDPDVVVTMTRASFDAFCQGIIAGEFDDLR